jgi:ribonuclease R
VGGGRKNSGKPKADRKERDRNRGGRKRGPKDGDLVASVLEEIPDDGKGKSQHKGHRPKRRGSSGEKISRPAGDKPAKGRASRAQERSTDRTGRAERATRETLGRKRNGGKSREERREGDYHRVKITGLNSAVWPDPPGYHERKEQEMRGEGAPKVRPHLNRKTEGGTGNSK